MANPYYTPSGNPGTTAPGASSPIRSEFLAISAGFDKLPPFASNNSMVVSINAAATAMTVVPGLTYNMAGFSFNFVANGNVTLTLPSTTGTLATSAEVASTAVALVPPGCIMDYAGAAAPAGWLLCQGQAVSRTTYSALYAALGGAASVWGQGDGTSTFNVPDLGGRVTAGKETTATRLTVAGSGVNGGTLASAGGAQTYALAVGELTAHTHAGVDHTHATGGHTHNMANHRHMGDGNQSIMMAHPFNVWSYSGGGPTSFSITNYTGYMEAALNVAYMSTTHGGAVATGAADRSLTSGSTGSSTAHQNTQPTVIVNKIIKT